MLGPHKEVATVYWSQTEIWFSSVTNSLVKGPSRTMGN